MLGKCSVAFNVSSAEDGTQDTERASSLLPTLKHLFCLRLPSNSLSNRKDLAELHGLV